MQTVVKELGTSCSDKLCPVRQAGVMLKGFHAAKLCPLPEQALSMHGSVKAYLTGLKNMGDGYTSLMPSACRPSYIYSTNPPCACFGDYGIRARVKTIVKRYVHADIIKQWERVSTLLTSYIVVTDRCRDISSEAVKRHSQPPLIPGSFARRCTHSSDPTTHPAV
jgi:hypothetical protein